MKHRFITALAGMLAAWLFSLPASATTILEMGLEDLVTRSELVFRGTVVDVAKTSVRAGGGEIPALHYTVRVDETFKGRFDRIKGQRVIEFDMVGNPAAQARRETVIPGFPLLETGKEYLLMLGPASRVGLRTTMGLGQGSFRLYEQDKQTMAVNQFNNANLRRTDDQEPRLLGPADISQETTGAIPYPQLAARIRDIVGS